MSQVHLTLLVFFIFHVISSLNTRDYSDDEMLIITDLQSHNKGKCVHVLKPVMLKFAVLGALPHIRRVFHFVGCSGVYVYFTPPRDPSILSNPSTNSTPVLHPSLTFYFKADLCDCNVCKCNVTRYNTILRINLNSKKHILV